MKNRRAERSLIFEAGIREIVRRFAVGPTALQAAASGGLNRRQNPLRQA